MSSSTKNKKSSLSKAITKTPSVRSSTRTGKGRNSHGELLETSSFKQKRFTTRIYLHVKVTKYPSKPSSKIAVVPCPYLHFELKDLNQNLGFEKIKDRILSAVASERFVQKYGDNLQYDSTMGVIGWMGQRDLDENPKKALKYKASFEIASNAEWNRHVKKYATKYSSESRRRKHLIIDLGIALYKNETGKNDSSLHIDDVASKKRSGLINEISVHLGLLKHFEGCVPAQELHERRKTLFQALPMPR
jgi:hypothetical protein